MDFNQVQRHTQDFGSDLNLVSVITHRPLHRLTRNNFRCAAIEPPYPPAICRFADRAPDAPSGHLKLTDSLDLQIYRSRTSDPKRLQEWRTSRDLQIYRSRPVEPVIDSGEPAGVDVAPSANLQIALVLRKRGNLPT